MMLAALVFAGLAQAATVFLHPPEALPPRLSPQQANLVLAAHLGLEQFEVVDQHHFAERDFVAQGGQGALLLLVDDAFARDIVPPALEPSFSFLEPQSYSWSSFLRSCTQRASHVYTYIASEPPPSAQGVPRALDIFAVPSPANEAFLAELTMLATYIDSPFPPDRFMALELTSVPKLAESYGRSSEQYRLAADTLRTAIDSTLASSKGAVHLALITYPSSTQRRSPLLTNEVKSSLPKSLSQSSCYDSFLDCVDATDDCSGHGQCVNTTRAGWECFVCACTTTVSETGKTQNWAGEMCQRRDVSGPFVLITGTVVTLILLMAGAISLLYAIDGQELPSILIGGVTGGARRE